LNWREMVTFVPLIILAFWIGIYPTYFTKFLDQPVNAIVERVRTDYFKAGRAQNLALPPSNAVSSKAVGGSQ
jgi:NADH:ubiquinone oxidoreductase subunit 4 (subunit M)